MSQLRWPVDLSSGCTGPPIAVSVRTNPETDDTKTCLWWFFPLMFYTLYHTYKDYSKCLDDAKAAGYE